MTQITSVLPKGLINAYKNTNYEVLAKHSFVLRVGQYSKNLATLFKQYGVNTGCFITAHNPFSRKVSFSKNDIAQESLQKHLLNAELQFFNGVGTDPSKHWEGEPSFFVLGLSLEKSNALAKCFEQNAIIWCDYKCVPKLILLR
tara:strand:+ start:264 stop:695 length:432 start_codon:yes stop_codon:yes gene_type:complete